MTETLHEMLERWQERENELKARAWDEGFNTGHYIPGEVQECDCKVNPYRPAPATDKETTE